MKKAKTHTCEKLADNDEIFTHVRRELEKKKEGKRKKGERKRGGGREERGKRKKKKEEKKRSFTLLSVAKHSLIPQVFPNIVLDQILKIFL